jgi:archaellum biogenesis protein FlaJ (TadC family)
MPSVPEIISAYKWLVLGLGIANIVIALLFLVWPNVFIKLGKVLNLWVPTEKIEYALNKNRDIDPQIIKIGKIIGYLSVALAVVLLILYFKV